MAISSLTYIIMGVFKACFHAVKEKSFHHAVKQSMMLFFILFVE